MTHYDHEIEIDAPADYVFDWGIQPENWRRSTPSIVDVALLEETDDGTRYRSTYKLLGRSMTSEELFRVDEDRTRTVSVFDDDEMRGELTFDYTELASGTRVHLHGDVETGDSLFDRAIRPVVGRYMNRQFRNSLQTMKELVEAEYSATAAEADAEASQA